MSKIVSEVMEKMIHRSRGNTHDIAHFCKVYAYAKTIGELEGLEDATQELLEITAILHDISCPLCREKYGNTNGKYQELESPPLVAEFLEGFELDDDVKPRISWLIAHHHTYENVVGLDYQILLEADFLVNADEMKLSRSAIENMKARVFKTKAGTQFLDDLFLC